VAASIPVTSAAVTQSPRSLFVTAVLSALNLKLWVPPKKLGFRASDVLLPLLLLLLLPLLPAAGSSTTPVMRPAAGLVEL
jgi:hypothetical protein